MFTDLGEAILAADAVVEEPSILEKLFGIDIPDMLFFGIGIGVIVVVIVIFILVGFFKEMKKK